MATRGQYLFLNSEKKVYANIYNHWDNYPSGAALLLNNMLLQEDRHGNTATQFLKANPNAELTSCIHGDIEYIYYIEGKTLRACEIYFDENDQKKERAFFIGDICDFINQYLPEIYAPSEDDTWSEKRVG